MVTLIPKSKSSFDQQTLGFSIELPKYNNLKLAKRKASKA
jgi:hypothetical protein